jgi:uncharacterized protein YbjT (DUF2867 family)
MEVVVFGASGRTGRLVTEQVGEHGWRAIIVVRRDPPPGARVVRLDDEVGLERALRAAGAVVSALGPIAGRTATEISDATASFVGAMQRIGPRRLVLPGNTSVFSDELVPGELANVAAEHRRVVAIARASGLDWTVVAPALLVDTPPTGAVATAVDAAAPGASLTRGDFAATLVRALEHDAWIGHVVGAANRIGGAA